MHIQFFWLTMVKYFLVVWVSLASLAINLVILIVIWFLSVSLNKSKIKRLKILWDLKNESEKNIHVFLLIGLVIRNRNIDFVTKIEVGHKKYIFLKLTSIVVNYDLTVFGSFLCWNTFIMLTLVVQFFRSQISAKMSKIVFCFSEYSS